MNAFRTEILRERHAERMLELVYRAYFGSKPDDETITRSAHLIRADSNITDIVRIIKEGKPKPAPSTTPQLSIIILNFNKAQLTRSCIKSIWRHTEGHTYEIIVVDNGSEENDYRFLAELQGTFSLIRLNKNRYFGEGNNIGAEAATGRFLIFMNNDVVVTPGWLPPLMTIFETHPDCGAAGPKFIFPNGLLQEAGALIDREGNSVQIGKFEDSSDPIYNHIREVDYISGATLVIKKTDFESVLGFDLIYEPFYYEDVDLCLKLKRAGLKIYYTPHSIVVHLENASTSDPSHGKRLNIITDLNRRKFVVRWRDFLQSKQTFVTLPARSPIARRKPDVFMKTAVIYTPFDLNGEKGERYLLTIAETLINAGYATCLATPERFSFLRIMQLSEEYGMCLHNLSLSTLSEFGESTKKIDLFVVASDEISTSIKPVGKHNIYYCHFPFHAKTKIGEIRDNTELYNVYLSSSDSCQLPFLNWWEEHRLPKISSVIIPPAIEMLPAGSEPKSPILSIVSFGRFALGEQQDLLIRTFRKLYQRNPNIELHLIGTLSTNVDVDYLELCRQQAQGIPVFFYFAPSKDKLRSLYLRASVYWGASSSIETHESFMRSMIETMSAGVIPVVLTRKAALEVITHGVDGFYCDSEDSLRSVTDSLLCDSTLTSTVGHQAQLRAQNFSKELFAERFKKVLRLLDEDFSP